LHALHLQVLSEARSSGCAIGQCYTILEGLLPSNSSSPGHDSLRKGAGTLRSKVEMKNPHYPVSRKSFKHQSPTFRQTPSSKFQTLPSWLVPYSLMLP